MVPLELTCLIVIVKVALVPEMSGEFCMVFKLKVPRVVPLAVMAVDACGT